MLMPEAASYVVLRPFISMYFGLLIYPNTNHYIDDGLTVPAINKMRWFNVSVIMF